MTAEYKDTVSQGPFLAFTRICLNNWHYISKKVLTLNEESHPYILQLLHKELDRVDSES